MPMTRVFTRQELAALGLPDRLPQQNVLLDEMFEEHRWEIEHRLVFRSPDDNQVYEIYYRTPTTIEGEGGDPWDDEATVEATLVEQRTVFRQEWRPVGSPVCDDEVQTDLDTIIRSGLQCAVCQESVGYVDAPTGGWWAHCAHPEDGHDAVSVIWGTARAPWILEEDQ